MKIGEFTAIVARLSTAFPGLKASKEACAIWLETLCDIPDESIRRAVALIIREREQLYGGTNLGALIRGLATPTLTDATVATHLYRAIELASQADGQPYQFLRSISPRLLEMAEAADIFNRGISSDRIGFLVRDVSKQFLEERRNAEKGFMPPAAARVEHQTKQLPAPLPPEEGKRRAAAILAEIQARRKGAGGER